MTYVRTFKQFNKRGFLPVLRIHDILGWIRIRIWIHGSMPLTIGSGSWIRILLFSSLTFNMPAKNYFFITIFSAYYFLKLHLHHFSKINSQKESQNSRNQGFYYYFCMMIEGSGSESIPLTNGSGSGFRRPKIMWIRWIRIRNTASFYTFTTYNDFDFFCQNGASQAVDGYQIKF
jgi:hypothetical protein